MKNNSSGGSGGIGLVGLLTVLFIALKLTNVINWTWLWVLSPLWISFGLGLVILLAMILISGSLK